MVFHSNRNGVLLHLDLLQIKLKSEYYEKKLFKKFNNNTNNVFNSKW